MDIDVFSFITVTLTQSNQWLLSLSLDNCNIMNFWIILIYLGMNKRKRIWTLTNYLSINQKDKPYKNCNEFIFRLSIKIGSIVLIVHEIKKAFISQILSPFFYKLSFCWLYRLVCLPNVILIHRRLRWETEGKRLV